MARYECSGEVNGSDIGLGLVNGLLIAIPLWAVLGVALAAAVELGSMEETGGVALIFAALCEALLLRPYLRTLRTRFRRHMDLRRADSSLGAAQRTAAWAKHVLGDRDRPHRALENLSGRSIESIEDLLRYVEPKFPISNEARPVLAPQSLLRQSLALGALAGAYLQYYFLEVNLQIASLHSVTVFAPVSPMS